ncbi:MAG: DnaJ domain-containing protein [Bacteroidales bacterium]|nr:DnaJ domain-containing protein [Bacteroidales bacterium]
MEIQAYFDNIAKIIQKELKSAKKSIFIAATRFTDKELFRTICEKSKNNIIVELILIDDEINRNSGINYHKLEMAGGKVLWIKEVSKNGKFMHNNFFVIDSIIVITGSYSLSYHARQIYENITVAKDDVQLANQFLDEFSSIKRKYYIEIRDRTGIDIDKISHRLEAIKFVIFLEDEEDIVFQINKLKKLLEKYSLDENKVIAQASTIKDFLLRKKYDKAIKLIENFLSQFRKVILYENQEIPALKLEIKALELQINSLENEKIDLEKIIREFEIRHNRELGAIVLKILELRKKRLKFEAEKDSNKQNEYEEAEKDYSEYQSDFSEIQSEKYSELSSKDKIEIKRCYRKASKLCHPDVVNDEQKEKAEKIFAELNKAYKENELKTVKTILNNLENGNFFVSNSDSINESEKLRMKVIELELIRDELIRSISVIKESETYRTIIGIMDWDNYFKETREKLEIELKNLENSD